MTTRSKTESSGKSAMLEPISQLTSRAGFAERYIPLAIWASVLLTLLFISLKVFSAGDARRHIAKTFMEKPDTEMVVVRPTYAVDYSPGWERLLSFLHRAAGWGADRLVSFSIITLNLCLFFANLPWLRRPEAWLAHDLQIFRRIQLNQFVLKSYEPWINKMRHGDRPAILFSSQADLRGLEWTNAVGNVWIEQLAK